MRPIDPGRERDGFPVAALVLALVLSFAPAVVVGFQSPAGRDSVEIAGEPEPPGPVPDSSGVGIGAGENLSGSPSGPEAPDLGEPGRGPGSSPFPISLQSLAVPGLGQARNGAWLKSVGFLGAYAVYMGWGINLNQDVQDARGRFHAASEEDARTRLNELEDLESRRNGKFWTAGFIALLAMADAYVDAHLRNFDERIDADVAIWDTGAAPAWGMTVTLIIDEGRTGNHETGRGR